MKKVSAQSGNVLVYILIAVVLFAALGFVVSNMMRGGTSVGGEKKAVMGDEILAYALAVREAVQALRVSNGCAEEQISFERSPFDGSDSDYVNASAPSNFSCHVFHPDGGGLSSMRPPSEISTSDYTYTGSFGVTDLGSDSEAELAMILPGLGLIACQKINDRLGLGAPAVDAMPNTDFYTDEFTGAYSLSGGLGTGIGSGSAEYDGKPAGCFFENTATAGEYFFYQVLLSR